MKKFAKIALALVLAVALVLPLLPVAEAATPTEAEKKSVKIVFEFDDKTFKKLDQETQDALWDKLPAAKEAQEINKPGKSVVGQVKALIKDEDIQGIADTAKVEANFVVEDIKFEKIEDEIKVFVVFGAPAKDADNKADDEEKPEKIDGYYEIVPYFVYGENKCKALRDWDSDKLQDLLDDLNEAAQLLKVNNVPDVDTVKQHLNLSPYEAIAKDYNDDYGYVDFSFDKAYPIDAWEYGDKEFIKSRIAKNAEATVDDAKVYNGVYYVPVKVNYHTNTYEVTWKIVPNETSLEKAMGYWPGRDITEKYDRVIGGNPVDMELWEIENIGKVEPCSSKVAFPLPDIRVTDKGGLWFYAPAVAPKAVKVKDSDPAKYEVTFEYIFAGTEEYEKNYKKAEKPADTKVAAKPADKNANPSTGDVMVLSYLVTGIAAAGAYVATKKNR